MSDTTDIAFRRLTDAQVAALRPRGRVRAVRPGEVLWAEGARDFAFFVVLRGAVEVVERSSGAERRVTVHEPGEFTGDVDMLTGRASLVTGRACGDGEVLELDQAALQRVVGELPDLSELLLSAFLARRTLLVEGGFQGLRIVGSRFSPAAHQLKEFASRNAIPFTWLDLEADPHAEALLRRFGIPPERTPIVFGRDGGWRSNPTPADLARYMGLDAAVADADAGELHDLVIVGGGPTGLAAAVYGASEGLRTLMLDAVAPGGQAGTSSRIENYLGFPTGISGRDLTRNALLQAQKFGARVVVPRTARALRLEGGDRVVTLDEGGEVRARCVLVASGADYRRPDVPRVRELEGAGVYYAATEMEARLCGGEEVVVVGGGNSAGQAAMYLSGTARRVHVVVRGDDLGRSMSRYLVDRIERAANVTVHLRCQVAGLEGDGELSAVRLDGAGCDLTVPTRALFLFIGARPRTDWLVGCVALDRAGFVQTGDALPPGTRDAAVWQAVGRPPYFLETSLPGVFAAGDARSGSVKRVASAVGEGAMAVSFVHAHLDVAR